MPFVNVNVDSYLPCGSRLKNEVNVHVSPCLSSVFIFTPCFCNFGVLAALLVLGSRLKNELNMHVSSVSPPCLFSLIAFEIRCIGRVLSVLGSRLKNEVCIHVSLCFSSMFTFTDGFLNLVYWQGTVSSRLTLKERGIHTNTYRFPCVYLRCLFSLHATCLLRRKCKWSPSL